ncbi:MAG: hypothetical protein HC904_13755 [Blastochloris sp.]|nr:hypothetical protein [Blastochloris sp.]
MFHLFNKNDSEIIVALEAGTGKVKIAVAELKPDGALFLIDVAEKESSGIRKGRLWTIIWRSNRLRT